MKLLIAIDSSEYSQNVLNEVIRRPWPPDTTACVLHVLDWPNPPSDPALISKVVHSADLLAKSAATKLANAGLRTTTKIVQGSPRLAVAEYAKEFGANLVLVGSHGANGLVRFLLGSVAQATLRRSPRSVEIVRKPVRSSVTASPAMKILLATDGSDCSIAAAKSVAQRPWPHDSQVRLVSVIPLVVFFGEGISPSGAPVYPPPELVDALEKQWSSRASEALSRAREILNQAHIRIAESELQPIGDARESILDEAKKWGADLIVVGSHGYSGVSRFMLGSVSESVAMHAHCSVEVIRTSGASENMEQ